jgi:hypothetical protein
MSTPNRSEIEKLNRVAAATNQPRLRTTEAKVLKEDAICKDDAIILADVSRDMVRA